MTPWIQLEDAKSALEGATGRGVKVAVIDSGIDTSHRMLGGLQLVDDLAVVASGHCLRVVAGEGRDVFGHGTAVAAVIHRLAPDASIGSIRVLGHDNTSRTAIIQRAAHEALDRGYQVINCSFGCKVEKEILQYKTWVDQAYLQGVHVVTACDNADFTTTEWPSHFASVIAVNMAKTESQTIFYYQHGTLVEFAAAGVNVRLPWLRGSTKVVTGSSFAAPRLAGLLARLLSQHPAVTPVEAKALLHKLAAPWTSKVAAANVLAR